MRSQCRFFFAISPHKAITATKNYVGILRFSADEQFVRVTPEREERPRWVSPRSRRQPDRPFSDPENLISVDRKVLRFYDELHRRNCVARKAA